jgi:hypothetical protein
LLVINLAMLALAVMTEIMHTELNIAGADRASDNADAERPREYLREDRDDVEPDHTLSSCHGATVSVPAAISMPVT